MTNRFSPRHWEGRRTAFRLQAAARALLPEERVALCGRRCPGPSVDLRVDGEGRAYFGGVLRCGSVWHCPLCAAKIAEGRRQEVRDLADRHCRKGGVVYMAAFTMPHDRWQGCAELRQGISGAWSKLIAGAPWKRARAKARCVGWVRALEVTHGINGWHPHLHAIFMLESDAAAEAFGIWLFERWAAIVARSGWGDCNPAIWRFERAAHFDAAAEYVVKGSFDMELTRGHLKLAKGGGRSPWQLLDSYLAGDRRAGALFRDFAAAFKGARQVTYSHGLRASYGLDLEADDLALSSIEAAAQTIGTLPRHILAHLMLRGFGPKVLENAERGGWCAVAGFLRRQCVIWDGMDDGDGDFRAAA